MAGIEFFDQVFEDDYCHRLLDYAKQCLAGGTSFGRSNFHWHREIVKASHLVLVMDLDEGKADEIVLRLTARGILNHPKFAVMIYAWTKLSYIPWHNDVGHAVAVTVFLNDHWPIDWGGLFLYKDGADIRGYPPRFNTGLRNQGNVFHSTTPVSLDAETPRFTLQLFPREAGATNVVISPTARTPTQ